MVNYLRVDLSIHSGMNSVADLKHRYVLHQCRWNLYHMDETAYELQDWKEVYEYITGESLKAHSVLFVKKNLIEWFDNEIAAL